MKVNTIKLTDSLSLDITEECRLIFTSGEIKFSFYDLDYKGTWQNGIERIQNGESFFVAGGGNSNSGIRYKNGLLAAENLVSGCGGDSDCKLEINITNDEMFHIINTVLETFHFCNELPDCDCMVCSA